MPRQFRLQHGRDEISSQYPRYYSIEHETDKKGNIVTSSHKMENKNRFQNIADSSGIIFPDQICHVTG
jgi:hypothetical protein